MSPNATGDPQAGTSLAEAFTHEHHAIDHGIEAFVAHSRTEGSVREWAAPLVEAMAALRRHIYLEEEVVFPKLRRGPLMMPIMVMVREHADLWRQMDDLEALLERAEADAGRAGDDLAPACRRMLETLDRHNSKEEPVIYPHLDADLDATDQRLVRDLLEGGTLPEGWVCEGLRA